MGKNIDDTHQFNIRDIIGDPKQIKTLNGKKMLLGPGITGKNSTVIIDQANEFKHLCEHMGVEEITVKDYLDGNVPYKGVFRLDISECSNEIAREVFKKVL